MQFAITTETHIEKWDLIRYAEELGYDRAYVADEQMGCSDCYTVLALAAVNTKRIRLGTGVAVPGTRLAPVTAHSIATINRLAPGRVFLGLGACHSSVKLIGRKPMPLGQLRDYIRVVRKLLAGEEVDYPNNGESTLIKFLRCDRQYINLDDPIPIYIAANKPKAIQLTGECADGWIVHVADPQIGRALFAQLAQGAAKANRVLPADFYTTFQGTTCVLKPGESLRDERVINETGPQIIIVLHLVFEAWQAAGKKDEFIPPFFANIWDEFLAHTKTFDHFPPREDYAGYGVFVPPEERRFVTPEAIRAICLAGKPDEIIARIRAMEQVGFTEFDLFPTADYQRTVMREFAELIMPALR